MSIHILKQGLFDSIQDHGRYGYQHLGINPSGVMDMIAASVANLLTGNECNEPVIEMHYPAASIYFEKACIIALSGGDFTPCINNEPVPINNTLVVAKDSILSFDKYKNGARVYLAVQGGYDVNEWLSSYSTNIKAKAGGYHGRALQKNDIIHCRAEQFVFSSLPAASFIVTPVAVSTDPLYNTTNIIRCIKGDAFENLQSNSQQKFATGTLSISRQSDRMGYRLEGHDLSLIDNTSMLSSAVTKGSIQLLPDRQLIVLMADHQTTGGYPVIAHVISADIPAMAQMQPGAAMQFQFVSVEEGEDIYLSQQQYLQQLKDACILGLKQFLS